MFATMTLSPPPRRVRFTAFGSFTYVFLIALVSAMILGPPISFLIQDRDERTLLERGVLAHFDLTASRPTHSGDGQQIDYVFEAEKGIGGAFTRQSRQTTVSDGDFAAFADPRKRFVLYDPTNLENAAPVTSRSALAGRRDFNRKFAVWFCLASTAIILLSLVIGVRELRRKWRLLRFGAAARPITTQYSKSNLGKSRVEFQFVDLDGKLRKGLQSFNFRIGIGGNFAPFVKDAVAFYDPEDPCVCELFLPRLSVFKFVDS